MFTARPIILVLTSEVVNDELMGETRQDAEFGCEGC
jgi:hypothetical protein